MKPYCHTEQASEGAMCEGQNYALTYDRLAQISFVSKKNYRLSDTQWLKGFKRGWYLVIGYGSELLFFSICTSFLPVTSLEIESHINEAEIDDIDGILEFAVYKEFQKLNRYCAYYSGKLPLKSLREFTNFLIKLHSSIVNRCFQEQVFPIAWTKAYVQVTAKVKGLKSCDQLWPVLIAPNQSKVTETFIYPDMMSQVSLSFDPYQ